jgi:glycosyltransferase involved in cell wall biosynthesis
MVTKQVEESEISMPMSVAICIGTFNQAQYLTGSVESALRQTYPIHEILVSDDCSTDNTSEVMAEICRIHPKVRHSRQRENVGLPRNLSSVLSRATTDLVVRLDSDDRLEPDYVAVLAPLMAKYPQAGFAHCGVYELDQHDSRRRVRRLARTNEFESSEQALKRNAPGFRVAANCILYRAQALREANYYYPNIGWRATEDWDLCLRIAAKGWGNVYADQVLSNYRVWEDVQQVRAKRKLAELATLIQVYKETLVPEYLQRGWNTSVLSKCMRRQAVSFADAIDLPIFTQAELREYKQLLGELGDSFSLSAAIFLADHGFNPAIRVANRIKLRVRDGIKGLIKAAR